MNKEENMKAKEGLLDLINNFLTNELTAINQYFIHAEVCAHWGYERLKHKFMENSVEEMRHAQRIIEHILYLKGVPNMQKLGDVRMGETVPEQFTICLKMEHNSTKMLNEGIAHCVKVCDNNTRHILEDLLTDAEKQINWLETQLETIKQTGLENYLSEQIKKEG